MSFWQKISSVVRQSFVILIDSLLLSVLTSWEILEPPCMLFMNNDPRPHRSN
jgi:hypothetical protein